MSDCGLCKLYKKEIEELKAQLEHKRDWSPRITQTSPATRYEATQVIAAIRESIEKNGALGRAFIDLMMRRGCCCGGKTK